LAEGQHDSDTEKGIEKTYIALKSWESGGKKIQGRTKTDKRKYEDGPF